MVVATPPPIVQSWADHEHAWRATGRGVEATSDGGVHWLLVFPLGTASGVSVDVLIRTSPRAGIASIAGRLWVTTDAGRHWYQAAGGPTVPAFGRGDLLFGTGGTGIDQAVEWPPRRLRCTGRWVHGAAWLSAVGPGPKPRTICQQDRGVDIRMRRVWTLPPHDGDWVVRGTSLVNGRLDCEIWDELDRFVGYVFYRDGQAIYTGP